MAQIEWTSEQTQNKQKYEWGTKIVPCAMIYTGPLFVCAILRQMNNNEYSYKDLEGEYGKSVRVLKRYMKSSIKGNMINQYIKRILLEDLYNILNLWFVSYKIRIWIKYNYWYNLKIIKENVR